MTDQTKAELLAEESLKRWGSVVVAYFPGGLKANKGKPTNHLWNQFAMPQPFVPVRMAKKSEWQAQLALVEEIFDRKANAEYSASEYVVLVTD